MMKYVIIYLLIFASNSYCAEFTGVTVQPKKVLISHVVCPKNMSIFDLDCYLRAFDEEVSTIVSHSKNHVVITPGRTSWFAIEQLIREIDREPCELFRGCPMFRNGRLVAPGIILDYEIQSLPGPLKDKAVSLFEDRTFSYKDLGVNGIATAYRVSRLYLLKNSFMNRE